MVERVYLVNNALMRSLTIVLPVTKSTAAFLPTSFEGQSGSSADVKYLFLLVLIQDVLGHKEYR
jgi:hypothetical protein